jgi:hypothetical protein
VAVDLGPGVRYLVGARRWEDFVRTAEGTVRWNDFADRYVRRSAIVPAIALEPIDGVDYSTVPRQRRVTDLGQQLRWNHDPAAIRPLEVEVGQRGAAQLVRGLQHGPSVQVQHVEDHVRHRHLGHQRQYEARADVHPALQQRERRPRPPVQRDDLAVQHRLPVGQRPGEGSEFGVGR